MLLQMDSEDSDCKIKMYSRNAELQMTTSKLGETQGLIPPRGLLGYRSESLSGRLRFMGNTFDASPDLLPPGGL